MINAHLLTTWDKLETLQETLYDMRRDLHPVRTTKKISFTIFAGDMNCEWPPGMCGSSAEPDERSYVLQEASKRMKLQMPATSKKLSAEDDWAFCGANSVKKMYDHLCSDTQLSLKGIVGDGAGSDRRPLMGEVVRALGV